LTNARDSVPMLDLMLRFSTRPAAIEKVLRAQGLRMVVRRPFESERNRTAALHVVLSRSESSLQQTRRAVRFLERHGKMLRAYVKASNEAQLDFGVSGRLPFLLKNLTFPPSLLALLAHAGISLNVSVYGPLLYKEERKILARRRESDNSRPSTRASKGSRAAGKRSREGRAHASRQRTPR
jgi:hypothetical protein